MSTRMLLVAVILAAVGAGARPIAAQSLADVSRKEAERRKEVKEPTKTFTNKDLTPVASSGASASGATPASPSGDKSEKPAADAKGTKADANAEGAVVKDQKYWAARNKVLHDKLETDKILVDAIQTRINALTADFVNRDDPAQRSVIAQNKQKALDELTSLQKAVADDTKTIADLEEEARKAGVPPGWLR